MTANFKAMINRAVSEPKGRELYDILRNIWDDEEFIALNLNTMDTPEKKQKLIGYIRQHDITSPSDVNILVDDIDDGLEPEFEECE